MACQRCEELEEEVAYLKSELGGAETATRVAAVRAILRGSELGHHARGGALLVLALYAAKGRVLSRYQLLEQIPPMRTSAERDAQIIAVWVCAVRKAIGRDMIENAWGSGYRLSVVGMDLIGRLVGDVAPIPEAQELQDRPPEELRTMTALIAGILAHKDGDGGTQTAIMLRRIAGRLTGQPRVAA